MESPLCPMEESLPPLFLQAFPEDCRPEAAETDVLLVATLNEAESRELIVGVLAYVPDDAEPLGREARPSTCCRRLLRRLVGQRRAMGHVVAAGHRMVGLHSVVERNASRNNTVSTIP